MSRVVLGLVAGALLAATACHDAPTPLDGALGAPDSTLLAAASDTLLIGRHRLYGIADALVIGPRCGSSRSRTGIGTAAWAADSSAIPDSLAVALMSAFHAGEMWQVVPPATRQVPGELDADDFNGPYWAPGESVDVVLEIRRGVERGWLRLPRARIGHID